MRLAVTGGSGIVGSALIRHLVVAGHDVVALARSDRSARVVKGLGATPMPGDVLDPDALEPLVAESDRVFHVAGVNEVCVRDPRRMWDVNVEGTRNVIRACRAGGVPRLVHTSSASTIGHGRGEVGSEATRHRGWYLSEYERSKTAAEELAREGSPGLEVVVVNPSSVQGPGRATGTGRIFLAAARGRLPVAVDARIALVDIDDCARGHVLAGEVGVAGERYLLSGATLSVSEGLVLLSEALGRKVKTRFVPAAALMPVAAVVEAAFAPIARPAPLCRDMVRVLAHGHEYDGSKAKRELGLEYTPIEETLTKTIGWFRSEGLLPRHR